MRDRRGVKAVPTSADKGGAASRPRPGPRDDGAQAKGHFGRSSFAVDGYRLGSRNGVTRLPLCERGRMPTTGLRRRKSGTQPCSGFYGSGAYAAGWAVTPYSSKL